MSSFGAELHSRLEFKQFKEFIPLNRMLDQVEPRSFAVLVPASSPLSSPSPLNSETYTQLNFHSAPAANSQEVEEQESVSSSRSGERQALPSLLSLDVTAPGRRRQLSGHDDFSDDEDDTFLSGDEMSPFASPKQQTTTSKVYMCAQMQKTGMCEHAPNCRFAHSKEECDAARHAVNPRYKTKVCRNYVPGGTGYCTYDARCQFLHPGDDGFDQALQNAIAFVENQLKNPSRSLLGFKTRMCVYQMKGRCENAMHCHFAHSKSEMVHYRKMAYEVELAKNPKFKTGMCRNFGPNGAGYCPYDVRCQFLHPEDDGFDRAFHKSIIAQQYREKEKAEEHKNRRQDELDSQ